MPHIAYASKVKDMVVGLGDRPTRRKRSGMAFAAAI